MDRRSFALAFLVIAAAVFWHLSKNPIDQPTPSQPREPSAVEESNSSTTVTPDAENDIDSSCLNPSQLRTHPLVIAEYERLSHVADQGPYFEGFRGLSIATLTQLADSGDSAAMVLLGANAELRARNETDLTGLDLVSRNRNLHAFATGNLSAESRTAYLEAANWYYKAALHGRVMVLHRYGQLMHVASGGPVELGWISQQDFDSLSRREKNALDPMNAYNIVTHELAPEILTGPMEVIRSLLPKGTERTQPIVDSLMNQFLDDLQEAGLPLVAVNVSTLPSLEYFANRLCPGYDLDEVFSQ